MTGASDVAGEKPTVQSRIATALVPARLRPRLFGAMRAARYRGHEVYCPCCETEFKRFIAHRGVDERRCPGCGSLERHRLLIEFLRDGTDLFEAPLRMLHVAPEYGLKQRLERLENLSYRTADLDSPLAMDRVDLLDMPYGDCSFDVVLCSHVLEHVADDRRALSEIRRVLVADGRALLMSPIDRDLEQTLEDPEVTSSPERHRIFGQGDHLRRYGRDFANRVAAAGFTVEVVGYVKEFTAQDVARKGLQRRESKTSPFCDDDIFLCRPAEREDAGAVIPLASALSNDA
jgi:SAM-dependent methyltransferase